MARSKKDGGKPSTPLITDAQERFCEEYLLDLNATRAYQAAYPKSSRASASACGIRLLGNARVAERLQLLMQERAQRVKVDADWVLDRLKLNAERAMQAEPVVIDGIPTGEYRYDGAVANGALKLLGEHIGLFTKKLEVKTPNGLFVVPAPATAADWAKGVDVQAAALKKSGVPGK